jgi:outer membrane biogenesis lipoprotein LolB
MKRSFTMVAVSIALMGAGCATTSAQEQRKAEQHQQNSDAAAKAGQYGVAGDEQRQAQESQNKAIMKGIDEGKSVTPVPPAPTTAAQTR